MALRYSSYKLMMVAALSLILLAGCANNAASNPSNYGQRSSDVEAVDATIEREAERAVGRSDARLGDARIRAHSYNGSVLLVGQVPSEELKAKAEEVTANLRGVEQVHNELSIAANLPASQRLTDTWLTTNVMSQLASNDQIDSSKLKITTENASVYLMGMVTREEADRIVNAVSAVSGVQRIVKVFEYIN
ncbi:BON domain-containing protein [Vreelandella alkaliphila]|uniref:BON domain-containing protein n=1 Tax=Vreelandella alkaliphila TaxID=272774 RepID=A0A7C9NPX3_9GAMM|nr:BON domain-containing protein [Halomonas alkaliphila]NDL69627.1 BON domain-containing protein [Halomonas alkaliphila]